MTVTRILQKTRNAILIYTSIAIKMCSTQFCPSRLAELSLPLADLSLQAFLILRAIVIPILTLLALILITDLAQEKTES